MNLFEEYYNYSERLATNEPNLQHSSTNHAFELIAVEEAFGSFRSKFKGDLAMRLLEYSYHPKSDESTVLETMGAFQILHKHSGRESGKEGFIAAMIKAQEVVQNLIHRMVYDSQNGHILFDYSLNKPSDIHVTTLLNAGDINWSGFTCSFVIKPIWDVCLSDEPFPIA